MVIIFRCIDDIYRMYVPKKWEEEHPSSLEEKFREGIKFESLAKLDVKIKGDDK